MIDYFEMGKDKKDKHSKDHVKKRKRDKDDDSKQAEKARKLVSTASSRIKRASGQSWDVQPVITPHDESSFVYSTVY